MGFVTIKMIKKVGINKQKYGNGKESISGCLYLPKKYAGKYVGITILSDDKVEEFEKKIKEYKEGLIKREEELKKHLEKLKELRDY